jgi:hypothetical protein
MCKFALKSHSQPSPLSTRPRSKIIFRIFADPAFRKTGGGPKIDVTCTASADGCTGSLVKMPKGWASRASALALVNDLPTFVLPGKK